MEFDTRYKSPSMRARRDRMAEDAPPDNPMEKPAESGEQMPKPDEKASGFAAVDVFGGVTPKPGQKFTIEIKDVDPDSREAEFMVVDEAAPEKTGPETPTEPEGEAEPSPMAEMT